MLTQKQSVIVINLQFTVFDQINKKDLNIEFTKQLLNNLNNNHCFWCSKLIKLVQSCHSKVQIKYTTSALYFVLQSSQGEWEEIWMVVFVLIMLTKTDVWRSMQRFDAVISLIICWIQNDSMSMQLSISSFASQRSRSTIHWSTSTFW